MQEARIGFIGQGWIGKHYADEFESRLYSVVRYALEEPYVHNKEHIKACEMVFIAVPTPTTPEGVNFDAVIESLSLLPENCIAVIKSTLLPGMTEKLQTLFPRLIVLHSPEFLVEATAAYDAANPTRNIIGIPADTQHCREAAVKVLRVLPESPYKKIMLAKEAEMVKYASNCFLYTKVIYSNIMHNLAEANGVEWDTIREAVGKDPRIGESHTKPIHSSGRGAGGHCFIKDFEAIRTLYQYTAKDPYGQQVLEALTEMNNHLLVSTSKDLDLLEGVFGEEVIRKKAD